MAGSGLVGRHVNVNGTPRVDDHLHRFVVQGCHNHFTLKVFECTTRMHSQEVFVFMFSNVLGRWPGHGKCPEGVDCQDDIAVLLSRGKDAEVTLGGGGTSGGGKLGHDTRIKEKVRGDVRVSHLCSGKIDGMVIAGVHDVEFSPEHAVDDGSIFHTCHVDVVCGGNCGFKCDLLSWDEFEVERSRHFCDWRGTEEA